MDPTIVQPAASPYLVPFDGSFRVATAPTHAPDTSHKKDNVHALAELVAQLAEMQPKLYAQRRHAVLLMFQAMDAAGKDGTIRTVFTGVNPIGVNVHSFKTPTAEELDHDFLWRVNRYLPSRGMIGVFNRSHYEEVLIVRVNPRFLDAQRLPRKLELEALWQERFESIRDAEEHWARNGTVVLKFWLNVSKEEQRARLLDRIDDRKGNWKFNVNDLETRRQWDDYLKAYEAALAATSRPWAPWYAIPADSKSFMRRTVAQIVVDTLAQLHLEYPALSDEERAELVTVRTRLEAE